MPPVIRSEALWIVAFYLSNHGVRVGDGAALPPVTSGTQRWAEAYGIFYAALGDGRTERTFRNTLQNARDLFDGHVSSGRAGWMDSNGTPQRLTLAAARVFNAWSGRSEAEHWAEVSRYARVAGSNGVVPTAAELVAIGRVDASIDSLSIDPSGARTEGGMAIRTIVSRERDHSLRAAALRIHGMACMACGLDFIHRYGTWGEGFAHVHHSVPLSQGPASRLTDPRTDLVVLCPNCHAMVHAHPPIVLSLDELKAKITN